MSVSGNMGHFDFFSLVDALVAGAVLLGIAQLVVSYIAVHALGLTSVLYAEHMEESVNWRMDYARFAVQSLVAGMAFRRYDEDGSGTLNRQEIYKHLTTIFQGERENGQILSLDEVACLSDFFLRHRQLTEGESELEEQSEGVSKLPILYLAIASLCRSRLVMWRLQQLTWLTGSIPLQKRRCRSVP